MDRVQDCPKCKLVNPPQAVRCDCGYDFAARRVVGSYLTEKDQVRQAEDAQARRDQYWVFLRLLRWFGRLGG